MINRDQFKFQFIYLPEKEKYVYIQTFNILQKCYLKVKQKQIVSKRI